MSKGNNSFDSDAYLLHSMQELIAGTFRNASNEFSKTLGDEIRKVFANEFSAKNSRNLTSKEIDNGFKLVLNRLEKMGLKPDNEFKSEMRSLINAMKKYTSSPTGNISQVELINKFIKDTETFIKASQDASRKGETKYFENISGGKVGKEILKEIRESLNGRRNGILGRIDDTTEKLLDFLGEQKKENKKNLENFGKELLDGLEKSKFVGGALTDTFKLLGLMGASWLSQFGQLGRILGGAFYVVMSTMGPQLVNLLLKGMGSLFWNTTKFLGSKLLDLGKFLGTKFLDLGKFAGRGALNLAVKGGGALGDLATAGTNVQKALAVGKIAGGLGVATAGIAGAVLAGKEAGKDWKSGHKGRAVGFGVGAGLMGAGGIAAIVGLFSAAVAPFALPLVAIGAGIAGLVALWKHHSDFIKSAFKKVGSFIGKALEFMLMFNPIFVAIKWIKEHWPWGGGGKGIVSSVKDATSNLSHNVKMLSKDGVTSYGKMKVAKDGSILNLHELSQAEASETLQAYEKSDPTRFNRLYEWADAGHANMKSFETDAVRFNDKGQKTGALLYAGASQDLDDIRSQLYTLFKSRGMSDREALEKANALRFTSGKATGSNTQHTINVAKMMGSHADPYARGVDLGGGSLWSLRDYKDAEIQKIISGVVSKHGISKITAEDEGGKSTAPHLDLKQSGFYVPEGAKQNLAEYEASQKAIAQKHSIEAEAIYAKMVDKELYDSVRKGAPEEEERKARYYENLLKKKEYGITYDKDKNEWIQIKNGEKSRIIVENADPDGNKDFSDAILSISKIVNNGV